MPSCCTGRHSFYILLSVKIKNSKIINAWCMYDWANSVYSLVITSAIFPAYYQAVTVSTQGNDEVNFFGFPIINSVLYSYSLSFSFLFVGVFLPLLSGIADYSGKKRLFLKIFTYLGALACGGLFLYDGTNVEWGILCSTTASIGYSGSLVFYDAYLPEIADKNTMDRVSARGYSFGYIGSIILLLLNLFTITNYDLFGLSSELEATRYAFLTVCLWWIGFSLIPFTVLPKNVFNKKPTGNYLYSGYQEIIKVFKSLKDLPVIKMFLISFFFYNMGVQTVMYMAGTFAIKELGMSTNLLIVTIMIIQIVAIIGAYAFAVLSEKRGNKTSIQLMIIIWIGLCLVAYIVKTELQFILLAFGVGLVMGGIQSLSRSTYSKLIPTDSQDHASFFSFYDVTFSVSVVIGTFSYGLVEQLTNSMRNSTLVLASYFMIGFVLLYFTKMKNFGKLEKSS